MRDSGFFSAERWLRNQENQEYKFKPKKIKRPKVYPMVAKWGERHFPKAVYRVYSFKIPPALLKRPLIENRIYGVDEFGRELIWQAAKDARCPLPEYVKIVERLNYFEELTKYMMFISPIQDIPDSVWLPGGSDEINMFLKNATLSQYVKYIDKIDSKALQTNGLMSLVEDYM